MSEKTKSFLKNKSNSQTKLCDYNSIFQKFNVSFLKEKSNSQTLFRKISGLEKPAVGWICTRLNLSSKLTQTDSKKVAAQNGRFSFA